MKKINKRYLFFEANEMEYETLRKNITNFSLKNETTHGFVLSHASRNSIEGSHVNQESKREEVNLPNGEKISFERPIVDIVKFKISTSKGSLLELTNPPRKTSVFLSDLELASNFKVALKSLNVNLHDFYGFFTDKNPSARAYFIYIKSTSLSEQTHASIKIESEQCAYKEGLKHFKIPDQKIEKIGIQLGRDRIEISRNGSISGSANIIMNHEDDLKFMLINSCYTKYKK